MLGDLIGEIRGQTISQRVLPDEGNGPRMEATDQGAGTLYGVNINQTVTYVGTMRPDGTVKGLGHGLVMTDKGGSATFLGTGVGKFTRPGVLSWRGAIYFETTTKELSKLNGIAAVYEYEIDESGKSEGKLYEWK